MNLIHKKLLIFDFDGTLIDSVPDLALSVNYMLQKMGYHPTTEEIIHTWVGNGAQTLVRRALTAQAKVFDNTLFEEALKIFLNYYEMHACIETTVYPHVQETLQSLQDKGYTMAIVTNKPYKFIAPILQTLFLEKYFEIYIGADSLKTKKPDPAPLLHVCKTLGFSIEESLMIGDSKNDILAAKNAQMDSIGVSYGYNYGEDITLYAPDIIIDDFSKMLDILE